MNLKFGHVYGRYGRSRMWTRMPVAVQSVQHIRVSPDVNVTERELQLAGERG